MKNKKLSSSRVKGFTLIELIIVMAIIAILAGISSIVVEGYRRDALIESNNKKAQIMYSAFQNMVLDCEIKQDKSMFNQSNKPDDAAAPNGDPLLAIAVSFEITEDGHVGDVINYKPTYNSSTWGETGDITGWKNSGDAKNKKHYNDIKTAIEKNVDKTMSGSYVVYIDFDNYVVDSVIYKQPIDGKISSDGLDAIFSGGELKSCKATGGKPGCKSYHYNAISNMQDHKKASREGSAKFGCYPYAGDLSAKA